MRRHVRWAKAAGIDGFLVSWKATSSLNQRLNKLARLAAEEDFKLGIVYQALDFEREPLSIRRIRADLDFFIERYADDPVFDIFEKPVVIWTGTEQFRRKQIARTVAPRQDDLLVLASEKNVEGIERLGKAVQGNAYYWSSVDPQSYMSFSDKLVAMGEAVHDLGGLWIAPAAPGFDARLVGGTSVVERRSGDTFRARLDGATRSAPDALGVISWNEFSENTHIEPSELYGQRYLEILADVGGATFDIEAVIDSSEAAGDERSATGVGYGAPLLGGVLALGVIAIVGATWRSRKAVTKESTRGNGESTPYSGEPRGRLHETTADLSIFSACRFPGTRAQRGRRRGHVHADRRLICERSVAHPELRLVDVPSPRRHARAQRIPALRRDRNEWRPDSDAPLLRGE